MRRFLVSLLAFSLFCCAQGRGANAVPNAGFEEFANGALKAWQVPTYSGCRFAVDGEVAHGGGHSIRVDGLEVEKQNRYVQAWRVNVPLPQEDGLWFTAWVKGKDLTTGRINILHIGNNGKVLKNQGIQSFKGSFDWREIGAPLARVEGAREVQLVLGLQKSTGTVWFDDLYVGAREEDSFKLELLPGNQYTVGKKMPAEFSFALGKSGLKQGGKLGLQWNNWRLCREFRIFGPRVECTVPGATFKLTRPPRKKSWPPTPQPVDTVVELTSPTPLPEGTVVKICCQLLFSKHSNVCARIFGTRMVTGNGLAFRSGMIRLEPQGDVVAALRCLAEPRPLVGREGRVTVAVVDRFGNPAGGFRGVVEFDAVDGMELPSAYTFTEEDAGSHEFRLVCPAGKVSRIAVRSGELRAQSNPILPRTEAEEGIYFGDIHSHCEISGDAVGDPDKAYEYARRFNGMDFAGLSDHSPRGKRWELTKATAGRHNDPGRFVALLGFEWSSNMVGHRNIYYPGEEGPQQPKLKSNMKPWYDYLAERKIKAVIIPHHTNTEAAQILANGKPAWQRCDWSGVDHRYQRVVEICQNRGSFEAPGGPIKELRILRKDVGASVQTALAMGHHLGFIGSTDTHSGRPGNGAARAAMVTADFSQKGTWQALYDRSCYATTGNHSLLFFTVNERKMGSENLLPGNTPRRVAWRAIGTAPIRRVDLLRNNEVVKSWKGEGDDMRGEFGYPKPLSETEWWYLRVIQEDGNLAWSSPVWVSLGKAAK